MNLSEIIKIKKHLDQEKEPGSQTLLLLQRLEKLKEITINDLVVSRIGLTVNSLRKKSTDKRSVTLCKILLKRWKNLLPHPEKGKSQGKIEPIRQKFRAMLTTAIETNNSSLDFVGCQAPKLLAEHLENAIFQEIKEGVRYRNRIRSRIFNLKDKDNPRLRSNFRQGIISAEKLSKMTAEDMYSDKMKDLREKFARETINDAHLAFVQGTRTDMFKCGRCKKKNCSYFQSQTRSCDEPMTTFVNCNECDNRWKFC